MVRGNRGYGYYGDLARPPQGGPLHRGARNVAAPLVGVVFPAHPGFPNPFQGGPLQAMSAFILCAFFLLFPLAPASAHAVAGGDGRISGQLRDGSNHNAPLAGQTVTLQMAQSGNAQDLATSTTDAHGTFSFSNLATDKTINYAAYIRYQGAQYVSDLITLDGKPVQQVDLTVYQATTSTANIAVVDATVLLSEPDTHKGTFSVSEIFVFKNLDTHAFVGSLDASKGKPNALFFSLPHGARNVKLSNGFDGYKEIQVDRGFASDAALPPGDSEFSFAFDVPYSSGVYDFSYVAMYPTVSLSFLVPPDMHANSGLLTSQGVITANQHPYRLFKASKLLANQEVHVGLEGLPAPTTASIPSHLNAGNIWLIVALLLMLAVLGVTWLLYRSQRLRVAAKEQKRATTGTGKQVTARAKKRASDRREELLAELLELDNAFESGGLTKAVYQERRAKKKAQLRALISEQEASRR
jgi:hypothetical protein